MWFLQGYHLQMNLPLKESWTHWNLRKVAIKYGYFHNHICIQVYSFLGCSAFIFIEELIQCGDNPYLKSPSRLIRQRRHIWNQAFVIYVRNFCCCWAWPSTKKFRHRPTTLQATGLLKFHNTHNRIINAYRVKLISGIVYLKDTP
jgi:hypothetical protein